MVQLTGDFRTCPQASELGGMCWGAALCLGTQTPRARPPSPVTSWDTLTEALGCSQPVPNLGGRAGWWGESPRL